MILDTVRQTISQHRLLERGDKILLAYSGGPDSTALLAVFLELRRDFPLDLNLVHFNQRLRDRSVQDERFVREVARLHGLPLFVAAEDVRAYASERGMNVEEAGRRLRYAFLLDTAGKIGGAKVATGHTMNDQAETFLLRLLRGSGMRGLSGIFPVVQGKIIRPLLYVQRKDIEAYLKARNLDFRMDESNLDLNRTRNRVRLELIPYIQEHLEPQVVPHLSKVVSILQEEDALLDRLAWRELQDVGREGEDEMRLDLKAVKSLPLGLARRVVRLFIRELKGDLRSVSFEDVDGVLGMEEGKCLHLGKHLVLGREKGQVFLVGKTPPAPALDYRWDGKSPLHISELNLMVEARRKRGGARPGKFDDERTAFLDARKLAFPLRIRNRKEGDRYRPLGAPGRKKLKEIMRAKGIPRQERDRRPVFVSGTKIAWVPGLPVGEDFKIDEGTKEILVLSLRPGSG